VDREDPEVKPIRRAVEIERRAAKKCGQQLVRLVPLEDKAVTLDGVRGARNNEEHQPDHEDTTHGELQAEGLPRLRQSGNKCLSAQTVRKPFTNCMAFTRSVCILAYLDGFTLPLRARAPLS
jgi:hypothetical protein